ncbi:hypothetical protein A6V29_04895 [Blastococcus sp. CCUG 61487]|nr:hypothetical protein A6V29_04895 [Blastococcus sp. CCUG 61487]
MGGQRDAYALAAASLRARAAVDMLLPVDAWTKVMAAADEMESRRRALAEPPRCWAPVSTSPRRRLRRAFALARRRWSA